MPEIFKHKKFQAGMVTSILIFLGQFFAGYDQTNTVMGALALVGWMEVGLPITAAIVAQGAADWGKEKAKLELPDSS